MSVVNDMLRDLEKRKAPERSEFSGSSPSPESMIEPRKSVAVNKTVIAIAICILIAFVAYGVIGEPESQSVAPLSESSGDQPLTSLSDQDESAQEEPQKLQQNDQTSAAQKDLMADNSPEQVESSEEILKPKKKSGGLKAGGLQKGSKAASETPVEAIAKSVTVQEQSEQASKSSLNKSKLIAGSSAKPERRPVIDDSHQNAKLTVKTEDKASLSEKNTEPSEINRQPETKAIAESSPRIEKEHFKLKLSPEARDEQTAESAKKLFAQGRSGEAYLMLESFVESNQLKSVSEALLAQAYLQDGKVDEFLSLLDEADKPLSAGLQQSKARWMMANKDVAGAVSLLQTNPPAIEKFPDHYALLASAYQKLGQHGKAFETYSELIQFNDEIADWWAGLGLSADQLGQPRQAKVAYQQALNMKGLNITLAEYIRQRLRAPEMTR